ncbi:MAG: sulfite exporter TauE/SafE family protein [Candidatus Marinimicrobia bacterium]|nr:sulfite exporter TauE/SafE family protein [Candidatus Neomarinimicrobiota bacterium]
MRWFISTIRKVSTKKQLWFLCVICFFFLSVFIFDISLSWGVLGLVILCFACELMDSSLGMGYGTTLTPVLLAFGYEPLELIPTILLSEFLSGFASSYFHHETGNVDFTRQSRDFRVAMLLALGSVVGVAIGVNVAITINPQYQLIKLALQNICSDHNEHAGFPALTCDPLAL